MADTATSTGPGFQVFCRFRPQNKIERENPDEKICVQIDKNQKNVEVLARGGPSGNHDFNFDHVFDWESTTQEKVFELVGLPIVKDVLLGINGSILVYGQTGAGKTFTMTGPEKWRSTPEARGLVPRIIQSIFEKLAETVKPPQFDATVTCSYIEIYNEELRDLLSSHDHAAMPPRQSGSGRRASTIHHHGPPLRIRKEETMDLKKIYVENAIEEVVESVEQVLELYQTGSARRAIASHRMNAESSRSHSIFMVTVTQRDLVEMRQTTGKLVLCDLAGSERASKTGAEGATLDEGISINMALTTLGRVIDSLIAFQKGDRKAHIPYRDSQLTKLLEDSLGGNSKTKLIINCSPSSYNENETLSTLRFGDRAKKIKNKPKVNKEISKEEMKRLLEKAEDELSNYKKMIKNLQAQITLGRAPTEGEMAELGMVSSVGTDKLALDGESEGRLEELMHQKGAELRTQMQEIQKLSEELESLRTTQDTVLEENKALNQQLEQNVHKVEDLSSKLQLTSAELQLHQEMVFSFEEKQKSIERATTLVVEEHVREKTQTTEAMVELRETVTAEVALVKEDKEALLLKVRQLQDSVITLTSERDALKASLRASELSREEETRNYKDTIRTMLQNHTSQVSTLHQQLQVFERTSTEIQRAAEVAIRERDELKLRVEKLQKELDEEKAKWFNVSEPHYNSIQAQLQNAEKAAESSKEALRAHMSEIEQQIKELKEKHAEELSHRENESKELRTQLARSVASLSALQAMREQERKTWSEKIAQKDELIDILDAKVSGKQREMTEVLEAERKSHQVARAQLLEAEITFNKKLNSVQAKHDQTVTSLRNEVLLARDECFQSQTALSRLKTASERDAARHRAELAAAQGVSSKSTMMRSTREEFGMMAVSWDDKHDEIKTSIVNAPSLSRLSVKERILLDEHVDAVLTKCGKLFSSLRKQFDEKLSEAHERSESLGREISSLQSIVTSAKDKFESESSELKTKVQVLTSQLSQAQTLNEELQKYLEGYLSQRTQQPSVPPVQST